MENRDEAMRYIEEQGSVLFKYHRGVIFEMLISYLEGQKKSKGAFRPGAFLALFQNLDEVWSFRETEEFAQYCYRNFALVTEAKREVAHFIFNFYTLTLKKTRNESIERYFAADRVLGGLLEDEAFLRVADPHYLTLLFSAVELRDKKLKLLELTGRRSEVVREHFKDGRPEEAHKFCLKNLKDPELPILLLQLVCDGPTTSEEAPRANALIGQLLEIIKDQQAFHPLFVVKILKRCSFLELKYIKAYLNAIIEKKLQSSQHVEDELERNDLLIAERQGKLTQLGTRAFMCQPTTCALCKAKLTNPALFFLCGHSYHSTCVEEKDCPQCVS